MKNSKKDWFKRIRLAFNAFSEEPFSAYQKRCLTPLLNSRAITPPKKDVFKALESVPFEKVKIIFLGQDPYYQVDKKTSFATGLAFALNPKILQRTPRRKLREGISLTKILHAASAELKIGLAKDLDTTLEAWAEQGVLLLNTALTTKPTEAGAHTGNWKRFIAALILALNSHKRPLIFVLTCKTAKEFSPLISSRHQVFYNYKHPSRCWRVYANNTYKGTPVKFFALTKEAGVNWEKAFTPPMN